MQTKERHYHLDMTNRHKQRETQTINTREIIKGERKQVGRMVGNYRHNKEREVNTTQAKENNSYHKKNRKTDLNGEQGLI